MTGGASIFSPLVDYTVDHTEEVGFAIVGITSYSGGTVHDATNDTVQVTAAATGISRFVVHTPTITTVIHDAAHAPIANGTLVPPGTPVHDQATVTGVNNGGGVVVPTGSVDFSLYDGTNCQGTPVIENVGLDGAGVAHPTATVNVPAGGISYRATYVPGGDLNYLAVTDGTCENVDTVITVQLVTEIHEGDTGANHEAANFIIQFGTTVAAGTVVHDHAFVTGNSGLATGSVDFNLFNNSSCTGGSTPSSDPLDANGEAESATAIVGTDTTGSDLSYTAAYNSTGIYPNIAAGDAIPACEHLNERSVGGVTEFFATDSGTSYGLWAGYAAVAAIIVAVSVLFARRRMA
jgi:hypothetical protein